MTANQPLRHRNSPLVMVSRDTEVDFSTRCGIDRSAAMLINVENRIDLHERKFGRDRLLRTIEKVSPHDLSQHVSRYRVLVRSNEWPNVAEPAPLAEFLNDYELASLAYVDVGFIALEFVGAGNDRTYASVYHQVVASEALRGQYGKQSPTGLDARLDWYEAQLTAVLDKILGEATPNAVDLLCIPNEPHLTAESAMLESFAQVRAIFAEPPTIDSILAAEPTPHEIVWKFLRRHAQWSIQHLNEYYHRLGIDLLQDRLEVARNRRRDLAARRSELMAEIARRCPATVLGQIIHFANALAALNHINLTLEPSFSFKGGVGLGHGLIFNLSEKKMPNGRPTQSEIARDKWALRDKTKLTTAEIT